MYLMLLAGIIRKGKTYNFITSYLASFALFAGLVVMIYPGDVFIKTIGINIQTMVCHAGMFVIAFLLLTTKTVKIDFKSFFKACAVFLIMLSIAMLLNVIWHYAGTSETFNMFHISPWYGCELPLLNIIYDNTPYIIFLIVYCIGFCAASGIILGIAKGFQLLEAKEKESSVTSKIINIIKSPL